MRLLKFLLVFLVTAILVVGSIFWINRDTFMTVFQNRSAILEGSEWVEKTYSLGGLIEFMAEQPQHSALISLPVSIESEGQRPENFQDDTVEHAIRYRSDLMHPAGTLTNLMLLITYAEMITSGSLDPKNPVDTEKIADFYIPGLDRRHERTFRRWKNDRESPLSVEELVHYLAHRNDPAVADYLFFFLGADEVTERASQLGDGCMEPPVPQFGLRMHALQHSRSETLSNRLAKLARQDRTEFLNEAAATGRAQWEQPRTIPEIRISAFQDQRALHGLYPRVRPDRFADLLASIWQGTLINEETSRVLRDLLQQSPDDRLMQPHISWYASQFDERMGFLGGWSAAGKKSGHFRVQIMLVVDIPAGLWFHMNSNFMIQDYHNRMLYDRDIQNRTYEMLMHQGSQTFRITQGKPGFIFRISEGKN